MAGDVQQPFSLSFQVDALHSSSISFGRFELESLSWERRSSFSHNRYLEEVEKCAKPGSVTEKKAYFEAHFRKRALLRQASSVSQAEREGTNSDSSSYSTSTCDENRIDLIHGEDPRQMVEKTKACQFDESPKGSSRDEDFRVFEHEAGLLHDLHSKSSLDNIDPANEIDDNVRAMDCLELKLEPTLDAVYSVENVKCHDNVESREGASTLDEVLMYNAQQKFDLELESLNQIPDVLKKKCISGCTVRGVIKQPSEIHTLSKTLTVANKTRSSGLGSMPDGDGDVTKTCKLEVKKRNARTDGSREKQTPLKAKTQKQTSGLIAPSLQSSLRQLKENPQNLKAKSPQEYRSEKELRPKRAVTPHPSTPEKSESRRQRPATSSTRQVTSTRKEMGQSGMNSSFRNNGGTEKKREKIMAADIRQLSRMPDMKEKQKLCSASNAVPRLSNIEKPQVVSSQRLSARPSNKTLQSENRMTPTPRSKPSSVARVKQVVSSTKSTFEKETDVHKIIDANGSSSTRSRVIETSQRKDAANIRKGGESERKPKAIENGQITKGKFMEAAHKDRLRISGHSFLRKSLGHNSCAGHHDAVTVKGALKVASGRNGNALLRKSVDY